MEVASPGSQDFVLKSGLWVISIDCDDQDAERVNRNPLVPNRLLAKRAVLDRYESETCNVLYTDLKVRVNLDTNEIELCY